MMRKVRHKNIVQFIGACTRKPNLCIVFEFMSGGSVYDWVRRVSAPHGLAERSAGRVWHTARAEGWLDWRRLSLSRVSAISPAV